MFVPHLGKLGIFYSFIENGYGNKNKNKNAMKRDLLCKMVVGAEYKECSRNLIAVALMVILHFGIYWVMIEWVVGLLWFMKNRFLVGMEVAFF